MMVQVGAWAVVLVEDTDGHLNLYVTHDDGTLPVDVGEDISDDISFGLRLTTPAIAQEYMDSGGGYVSVSVIVEGAVDEETEFPLSDPNALSAYIARAEVIARADGIATQVYTLVHEHPSSDEECDCIQYLQSLKPAYEWNITEVAYQ